MSLNSKVVSSSPILGGVGKKYPFIFLLFSLTVLMTTNLFATAPDADFSVDNTAPVVGETVTFIDASTGGATGWNWNFGAGANPGTATGQGPHQVTYTTPGLKTVSLTASNGYGNNTEIKTNYIQVYATYYSTGSGDPTNTNSWNTNRDGISGTAPSNTDGDCLNFIIQNGHTMTTTGTC
jgi:PKD repeat protein